MPRARSPFASWLVSAEGRALTLPAASTYASLVRLLLREVPAETLAVGVTAPDLQCALAKRPRKYQAPTRAAWKAFVEFQRGQMGVELPELPAPATRVAHMQVTLPPLVGDAVAAIKVRGVKLRTLAKAVWRDVVPVDGTEDVLLMLPSGGRAHRLPSGPFLVFAAWGGREPTHPVIPAAPGSTRPASPGLLRRACAGSTAADR